ncbi:hypothetical protein BCR42DRAFT_399245 [Absidia repens]|uniref:Uncharacterized protein n=1 Tax=Absidia repens TaxID=90262 RepID=A0A1X2IZR5_9FUNG|nr:hypothetical protein BCR42DRAFT_399245 [Absidia repens]
MEEKGLIPPLHSFEIYQYVKDTIIINGTILFFYYQYISLLDFIFITLFFHFTAYYFIIVSLSLLLYYITPVSIL